MILNIRMNTPSSTTSEGTDVLGISMVRVSHEQEKGLQIVFVPARVQDLPLVVWLINSYWLSCIRQLSIGAFDQDVADSFDEASSIDLGLMPQQIPLIKSLLNMITGDLFR